MEFLNNTKEINKTDISITQRSRNYWEKRAKTYTDINKEELVGSTRAAWLNTLKRHVINNFKDIAPKDIKVLDIGTGPGFMAIIAALEGFNVSAVDFSESMLAEASLNIKNEGLPDNAVKLFKADAHDTGFSLESFDVIFTRNLTWNLQDPVKAYKEWYRILKKGGILLNYDANWYSYLYDKNQRLAYEIDRKNVRQHSLKDKWIGDNFDKCEDIARNIVLSRIHRPEWDLKILKKIGFIDCYADTDIWKKLWSEDKKINFASTPLFEIKAKKQM